MVFSSNPLSLSVPEPAFESWLRDSGYLDIVDQRSSDLHRISSADTTTTTTSIPVPSATAAATATISVTAITGGFFLYLFSHLSTLLSLLTLNPFAKLTTDDFAAQTPSWTHGFVGFSDSYSFPSSSSQAKMRVHENVKRYARNYATLLSICFACALYQMPLALVGLISCMALWDFFKFCSDKWVWDQYPLMRQTLVRVAQCVTAIILIFSNIQMALFCALGVGYAAMVLHAAFRKLTPIRSSSRREGNRRL